MPATSQNVAARPLRVLISAGEASGEMHGAGLLTELRRLNFNSGPVEAFGLGGERMAQAGCENLVEARNVAVVGLAEVVSHLPRIWREFRRLVAEARRRRPDVAVLIDFPEWNLKLARELFRLGVPVVYYISPQLWAWRRGRVRLVERYVRKMIVIFPFEQEFYRRHGVEVEFVGHPLGWLEPKMVDRAALAERYGLDASKTWIALLPGSRRKELRMNLPGMLGAAARLGSEFEFVLPVASTLERHWVEEQIRTTRIRPAKITLMDDSREALAASRAAVVASGTATVEAAATSTPFVMVYRLSPLTYGLGRHLVKVPFYGMVNLVAGRRVVPELIQRDFTPEAVERELRAILAEGEPRRSMLEGLAEVRARLHGATAEAPAVLAARAVLMVAAGET